MVSSPLPVTVVTGFLGAGKTTLENAWLAGIPRGEVTVIVNEQGRVGIDGELLTARTRAIVEITGGCVCCTTQAELVRALKDLAEAASPPGRVLIETSGAASPAGVLRAIAAGGPDGAFALDGVITVVDASRVEAVCQHDLALEQIGYADIVVLSRVDACDPDVVEHAAGVVAAHNGAAVVVVGARGVVPAAASLDDLLVLRRSDLAGARPMVPVRAHRVYASVSMSMDCDVDGDRFADFVDTELAPVAGRLFRTKGILAVAGVDERVIVQGVADTVEFTFGEPWADASRHSRLVVVGFALDRAAIEAGFARCAVQETGGSR
jgi:G3E family GTPase